MIGFSEATGDNTDGELEKLEAATFRGTGFPQKCVLSAWQASPPTSPSPPLSQLLLEHLPVLVSEFPRSLELPVLSQWVNCCSSSPRCQSRIVRSLPAHQKPDCRPYWEKDDPSMPLPFDLTEVVSELRGLLLEARP